MKYKPVIAFLLPLLAGGIIYLVPLIGLKLQYLPGDMDDGRFNMYLLEHNFRFASGDIDNYWNAGFMYPESNVITYSDNLLGSSPLYFLPRMMGADRELAYQLWILMVTVLNFTFAFLLFRSIFKDPYAAGIGAFVFAFSLALFSQTNHPQTFPRFAVPLVFFCLLKFMEHFESRYFMLALLFIVLQIYSGIYLGLMTLIPVMIMLILMFIFNYERVISKISNLKWVFTMLIIVGSSMVALLPIVMPYYERGEVSGTRNFEEVFHSIPTFDSYFFAINGSWVWQKLTTSGMDIPAWWDHMLFPGIFCMLSVIIVTIYMVMTWRIQSAGKKMVMLTFFICFLIFLRVGEFSLYKLVFEIPGFDSMRSVTRYINIELMFFGWFASFMVQLLFKRLKEHLQLFVFVLLTGILAMDNFRSPDAIDRMEKEKIQARVEYLKNQIPETDTDKILAYTPATIINVHVPGNYHLDAMLAAQDLGMNTFNAYTATCPGAYGPFWREPTRENLGIWLEANQESVRDCDLLFLK